MVLAWGVLAPLAVLIARFFKVMPGQDWPRELDNQTWWRSHWLGQSIVVGLTIVGVALVLPADFDDMTLHNKLGYAVLFCAAFQVGLGALRGSKGGPTAPASDGSLHGHHYDMTQWRRLFETLHKVIGYGTLCLAVLTIVLGLWKANAPVWMWLVLSTWWATLVIVFVILQKRGMAVDTYQAIWGPGLEHPGNRRAPPGWGMKRVTLKDEREDHVRGH
jgi:hypothetical protein